MEVVTIWVGYSADGFKTVSQAMDWIHAQGGSVRYRIRCHRYVEVD